MFPALKSKARYFHRAGATVYDRIKDYCTANAIDIEPLRILAEGSEWALPRLASDANHAQLDFALIDGCHSFPMVMVDFFYINTMMKKGGFLLIDDIELHSVAELARLLSYQTKDFRLTADLGKLRVFEKLTDDPLLGWWGMQPYVVALSGDGTRRVIDSTLRGMIRLKELSGDRTLRVIDRTLRGMIRLKRKATRSLR